MTCQSLLYTKFEVSSYTSYIFMKGGTKFTNLANGAPTTPPFGVFVMHYMGHAKVYLSTKFEVCSYIRYKSMKGVQNLQIWPRDPHHAPYWGILSCIRCTAPSWNSLEEERSLLLESTHTSPFRHRCLLLRLPL